MEKTRDQIYVELYDAEDVRMVTEYLRKKQMRIRDRERKMADNAEHLAKIAMKKGA